MTAKELTIAVLLTIVIGSNGDLYSNHNNYNSKYAQRPVFMFKPTLNLPQKPPKPLTVADLIALFDATGYSVTILTNALAVADQGPAAVKTALGSYPANIHAALQALANASSEVAQQFMIQGPQFWQAYDILRFGMAYVTGQLSNSINGIVNNANSVSDPVAIQQLTNVFDVLRYLATVLFNVKVEVSPETLGTAMFNIANIHTAMAQILNTMVSNMGNVASFSLPKQRMASFLGFIISKIMQLEVKPCSAIACTGLSQFLPVVKNKALNVLSLYQS